MKLIIMVNAVVAFGNLTLHYRHGGLFNGAVGLTALVVSAVLFGMVFERWQNRRRFDKALAGLQIVTGEIKLDKPGHKIVIAGDAGEDFDAWQASADEAERQHLTDWVANQN